ncbi:hypothetical protein GBAR_LOCUS22949 [Geodia barretti]|uniref:Uncharacterized protein n=1 Tax=Geodia barretti TaxID=519541 RepID=A0AA35X7Q1_GEOBA|nr:hypothetical protein GBAR_LOCUS22949 [Geodia barretti]
MTQASTRLFHHEMTGSSPGEETGDTSRWQRLWSRVYQRKNRGNCGGGAAGWMRELFRRRIAIVGLKRKDHELVSNRVTIFMSFHNLYNSRRSKMRKRAANRFCQIVQSMRELTATVVIAGADLNQPMRSDSLRIPQYKPTLRRRSRVIDYFILDSPPGGMEHSEVTALDIIGNLSNLLHIPMSLLKGPRHAIPDYRRAINHDPLIISVTL